MKIRSSFVANSSSSSFMIVGTAYKDEEIAEEKSKLLTGKNYYSSKQNYDDEYIVGINIDPGIADGCECDAEKFVKSLQDAIDKCKANGIENPTIYAECSYDC